MRCQSVFRMNELTFEGKEQKEKIFVHDEKDRNKKANKNLKTKSLQKREKTPLIPMTQSMIITHCAETTTLGAT
jgi:uncharacterized protein involved in type VI secretion and phage assembly